MKKVLVASLVVVICLAVSIGTGNHHANSVSAGAPEAKTGSPGDGATCLQCHGSSPGIPNGNEAIQLSGLPVDGYIPENTYSLSLSATGSSHDMFGFEISPQNWEGDMLGSWIFGTGNWVNNVKWLTQDFTGTAGSAGSKTWDFQWTAPALGTGDVNFYFAVLFANGINGHQGDVMLQDSVSIFENTTVGVEREDANPIQITSVAGKKTILVSGNGHSGLQLQLFSLGGRLVYSCQIQNETQLIDLSAVAPGGIYVATARAENSWQSERILLLD